MPDLIGSIRSACASAHAQGATTQVCVETTARDAFMRDFQVTVLSDCTASFDRGMHDASLRALSIHFGRVMDSTDFFRLVSPAEPALVTT